MGRLDDIQTALQPIKKAEKIEIIILGLFYDKLIIIIENFKPSGGRGVPF